jgi:biotin carboxylase
MRSLLMEQGINTVRFCKCQKPEDVRNFLNSIGKPVVIKPATGSGSAGVSVVRSSDEVEDAWKWVSQTKLDSAIAEEYVDGPEYSVESLTLGGKHHIIAITEKLTTEAPHFVEIGHQLPAQLSPEVSERIHQVVLQLLDTIQHQVGPAHTEVRISSEGIPKIIETQTRFGGDQIWEMVELVCGVDFVKATCAHLLSVEYQKNTQTVGGAAIRFFAYADQTVKSVLGLEQARAIPGVVRIDCKVKSGDKIGSLTNSQARQGYVLATGEDIETAIATAQKAMSVVKFEFVD